MLSFIIYKSIICLVIFAISLGIAAYSTWWERKFAAFLQDRKGPSRAGPFGLLQPLADGLKLLLKETVLPSSANLAMFIVAPVITFMLSLIG